MLKGVSRQIVEITQTENPYFERVFLVVRPICREFSTQQLDTAARHFLQQQSPHSGLKRARRKYLTSYLVSLLLGSALGVTLTLILYTLI